MARLPHKRSFGSSRNLSSFVGEERLRDEPIERLRGRLLYGGRYIGEVVKTTILEHSAHQPQNRRWSSLPAPPFQQFAKTVYKTPSKKVWLYIKQNNLLSAGTNVFFKHLSEINFWATHDARGKIQATQATNGSTLLHHMSVNKPLQRQI